MGIVSVLFGNVTHTEQIELLLLSMAGDIHGKQDWPGDQAADKGNGRCNLQIAKQKVRVQRLMVQHVGIGNGNECRNPIEQAAWQIRRALPDAPSAQLDVRLPRNYTHCSRSDPKYVLGA